MAGARIDPDFFQSTNARPLLGRALAAPDFGGSTKVIVMSDSLWRAAFGGAPNLIGRQITVNGETFIVVGVMPADFDFPHGAHLWLPRSEPGG